MKTVYLHDGNGLFTGAYECQESPLEPGHYIVPVDSLDVAPAPAEGFWPVAKDGRWVNVQDYRGQTMYSIETGEPVIVAEVGEIPEGFTLEEPPKPAPTPEQIAAAVSAARQAAYTAEADPLFFKSERGEATREEWLAKIDEIRARYPDGVMPS